MNTFTISKHHVQPYYHHYLHHSPTCLFIILLFLSPLVVRAQDTKSDSDSNSNSSLRLNPFHTLSVVFLAVLAFLGYIFLYLIFKHCLQPWASRRAERLAHVGLDPSILKTLPVFAYSNITSFLPKNGPVECAVCLGLFEGDEKLRLLPKCGHVFHVDCVDPWLKGHSTCPLCRANLVPQPEELDEVDSRCVVVELEGEEEEVNVGANDVVEVARGDMERGRYGKIWRWNSTGHVARCQGTKEDQRSTERGNNIGSRELYRSRSCIIIRLEVG